MNDSVQKTVPNIPAPFLNAVLGSGPWTKDTPHQPEHLYAKEPCPDCKTKQATIDRLRGLLCPMVDCGSHVIGGGTLFVHTSQEWIDAARKALRETKP
jgi:hypothetical protein